jgi:hypothetical protein
MSNERVVIWVPHNFRNDSVLHVEIDPATGKQCGKVRFFLPKGADRSDHVASTADRDAKQSDGMTNTDRDG